MLPPPDLSLSESRPPALKQPKHRDAPLIPGGLPAADFSETPSLPSPHPPDADRTENRTLDLLADLIIDYYLEWKHH
jgi:hypothetical protein